ncbi:hypothetical protein CDIK_1559 [Cucumispora dikerogammari]|nr:hypothetical protein CDIK_1559 [Cucumispora dikerogammari]
MSISISSILLNTILELKLNKNFSKTEINNLNIKTKIKEFSQSVALSFLDEFCFHINIYSKINISISNICETNNIEDNKNIIENIIKELFLFAFNQNVNVVFKDNIIYLQECFNDNNIICDYNSNNTELIVKCFLETFVSKILSELIDGDFMEVLVC